MNRYFFLTILISVLLFINSTYGEEATKVEHKTSTIPIREHARSSDNENTAYMTEDDALAKLQQAWENILDLNPGELDGNFLFELSSLWEDDQPIQYEASIKQYDPANPQENSISDDELLWEILFESLMNDQENDFPYQQLDAEAFSRLISDWKEYIDYLYNEFTPELDGLKSRAEIDTFMFDNIDDSLKKDLAEKNINSLNSLIENANQMEQEFVLTCLNDMYLKLSEKILSNIDTEELMKSYLELLDQMISDVIPEENATTSTDKQEIVDAMNKFESSKDYDINELEKSLENTTYQEKQTNVNTDLPSHVFTCSDLNNKADFCEANVKCMFVAKEGSNNELGKCKLNPYYMEHLVNSGCKMEAKADLLSIARDLQSEGIFDHSTINYLRSIQDMDELCKTITYTYFGDFLSQLDIPEASEYDTTEWNTLSPQEKLNLILTASEEM